MALATPSKTLTLTMDTEKFINGEIAQIIEVDEAKFMFDHAEKMLKDTLDTNTLIVTRVTALTTVTATLMIALFGFAITRFDANKIDILFYTAVVGIVYLFVIAIILFRNAKPNSYYSLGVEPKDLATGDLINKKNKSYRMIAFYINEIHELQKRILYNKGVNKDRWGLYKTSLIMLVCTPILLTIVYFLLAFRGHLCG